MASIQTRKTRSGKTKFRVQVRLKGRPPQYATFERKTDAKKWVQDVESAIREGRYFKTTEAKRHTLGDLIDRYIRDVLPTKGTQKSNQKSQLIWWKEQIGDYTLADVTPALLGECRDLLLNSSTHYKVKRSPATTNRYLAALAHALSVAVQEWGWLDDSPMRKIRKPTEPRGRVRFLSDDERERLLKACEESDSPYLYTVVVLALSTGARKSEIMNLKWKDVDLNRNRITLEETKNHERRILPLAGHALQLVKDMASVRRIDTHLLFSSSAPDRPADVRYHWNTALRKAGIENFRFHDLRHTAASALAMNGASLAEIADVLGHKTLQMVKRYAHLSEAHTARVVARMNEKIFG
jgi:integrase